jgi:hypothetical protein
MRLLLLVAVVLVVACASAPRSAARSRVAGRAPANPTVAGVLTSPLSRAVAINFTSSIESEMAQAGLRLGAPIFLRAFKYSRSKLINYVDSIEKRGQDVLRRFLNQYYYSGSEVEVWVESTPGGVYKLFKVNLFSFSVFFV